jgi:AAA family ATP:ADP antiporter
MAERPASPLKAILDVRKGEWPLAAAMCGYFFLVIATFWILKPIKKGLFIQLYARPRYFDLLGWHLPAADAELLAKVANMLVAFVAVAVFTFLARRLQREKLTMVFAGFFIVTLAIYSFLIGGASDWVAAADAPGTPPGLPPPGLQAVVWSLYLFGDLFSTLMVATFFAFLNDSVTPSAAKRLYGLIVLGGVAGGAFGTSGMTLLDSWMETREIEISNQTWVWTCVLATAIVGALAMYAGGLVRSGAIEGPPDPTKNDPKPVDSQGNAAIEGAMLVFRSPYLLSIVAIVGLYEIVSTIMDFQFTATVEHALRGDAIGDHFTLVYAITNGIALVVQLFLATFVLNRFPLRIALLITPIVILASSGAFLVLPVLWIGSSLNTADNAFNYSINQSARETLYTPTTRDEKYKAKAFIDMFVQRFAKAIAVGVTLLIRAVFTDFSSVRWLSGITIFFVAIWVFAAWYGGGKFRELTREDGQR